MNSRWYLNRLTIMFTNSWRTGPSSSVRARSATSCSRCSRGWASCTTRGFFTGTWSRRTCWLPRISWSRSPTWVWRARSAPSRPRPTKCPRDGSVRPNCCCAPTPTTLPWTSSPWAASWPNCTTYAHCSPARVKTTSCRKYAACWAPRARPTGLMGSSWPPTSASSGRSSRPSH